MFQTEEGYGQCYHVAAATSSTCTSKSNCPNGQDCDTTHGNCYAPAGFLEPYGTKACNANGCAGNRLCKMPERRCATPTMCATEDDCPAGYICDAAANTCIMTSVHVASPQCNMNNFCSANSACSGDRICVDRRCCDPYVNGLRTATLPIVELHRHYQGFPGAPPWNAKIVQIGPNEDGQSILPGDSGGPHFFNGAIIGVTAGGHDSVYAGAFRDWVHSIVYPRTSTALAPQLGHAAFGGGSDLMKLADVNGDGRDDLLWFPALLAPWSTHHATQRRARIALRW